MTQSSSGFLERQFRLAAHGSTVWTEVLAGTTTFLTMAYIIFVQPTVLSAAGMDFGAVMVATCLSSAAGCVLMALLANYPIALAPGMGQNFFFVFDTVGTLVSVSEQAGLMRDGELPRARQAFLADAIATVVGAGLGTSTVTSYVESAAGVAVGGRTGLTSLITAAGFLLALLFHPLVRMIGGGVETADGLTLYPVVAPTLIVVGALMVKNAASVDWDDATEGIPAFLTLIVMPLAVSITEGIAFGFIAYSFLKLVTGRWREPHWLVHLFAALFLMRYVVLG